MSSALAQETVSIRQWGCRDEDDYGKPCFGKDDERAVKKKISSKDFKK